MDRTGVVLHRSARAEAEAFVFSLAYYVPDALPSGVDIIPPSIDPFSPKNRALDPADVDRIVRRVGLYAGDVEVLQRGSCAATG